MTHIKDKCAKCGKERGDHRFEGKACPIVSDSGARAFHPVDKFTPENSVPDTTQPKEAK